MKEFSVKVKIMAENRDDLIERMEDTDNPIDNWEEKSIKEIKE